MLDLIERKSEGKQTVIEEPREPEQGRTMNFMKALEASLKQARGKSTRASVKTKTPVRRRKSA
jgi:non-homologous end joining protein Ku